MHRPSRIRAPTPRLWDGARFSFSPWPATIRRQDPFLGVCIIPDVTPSGFSAVVSVKQRSMSLVAAIYFYRKALPCWKSLETSSTPSPVSSLRPSSSSAAPSTKSPSPLATKAPALLCGGFLRSGDTSAGPRYAHWGGDHWGRPARVERRGHPLTVPMCSSPTAPHRLRDGGDSSLCWDNFYRSWLATDVWRLASRVREIGEHLTLPAPTVSPDGGGLTCVRGPAQVGPCPARGEGLIPHSSRSRPARPPFRHD